LSVLLWFFGRCPFVAAGAMAKPVIKPDDRFRATFAYWFAAILVHFDNISLVHVNHYATPNKNISGCGSKNSSVKNAAIIRNLSIKSIIVLFLAFYKIIQHVCRENLIYSVRFSLGRVTVSIAYRSTDGINGKYMPALY